MKHGRLFLLIILFCAFFRGTPQSVSTSMGGRAAGVGYTSETLADEWSLFNNPGGLAAVRKAAIAFSAEAHPRLEGAGRTAVAITIPAVSGTIAAGFFRFGDDVYNEQVASAAYSNQLGLASAGIKVNYIQYAATGFGTHGAVGLDFGGIAELTPWLRVGAMITNLNQPALAGKNHERLPVRADAGISIRASDKFLFLTGIQKDLDYIPVFRAALEYTFHPALTFRTGLNLHPDAAYGGFGIKKKRIKIDYGLQVNNELQSGHHLSFIYGIQRQPKHP